MKIILLLAYFNYILFAVVPQETPKCKALYSKASTQWTQLQPLLKMKIASQVTWDLIHTYLDAASLTLAQCESSRHLDFRYIRELKQGMKQADNLRNTFKVQTYQAMVAQAKREGKCTLIYRQSR